MQNVSGCQSKGVLRLVANRNRIAVLLNGRVCNDLKGTPYGKKESGKDKGKGKEKNNRQENNIVTTKVGKQSAKTCGGEGE